MGSIFCDGACSGNGTRHAVAGWAWAYWPGAGGPGSVTGQPTRSGGARLAAPATNQRAELMALLEALRWWSSAEGGKGGSVTVYTDSMYAINCTSKWGPSWARKGWKRDSGEPLQNLDLIKPLVALWRPAWRLEHVRGHQTGGGWQAYGNNWVDRAAVAAAGGSQDAGRPAVNIQQFVTAAAEMVVEEPLETPAGSDVIEHVPVAAATGSTATAHVLRGMAKPVYQTDLRAWFGQR